MGGREEGRGKMEGRMSSLLRYLVCFGSWFWGIGSISFLLSCASVLGVLLSLLREELLYNCDMGHVVS